MNVACPECQSVFRVDPARVLGGAVRARCSVCGGIIAVSEHARWGEDFPDARLDPPKRRESTPERTGPAPAAPAQVAAAVPAPRVPLFASRRPTPATGPAVFPGAALRPPTPRFVPAVPVAPAVAIVVPAPVAVASPTLPSPPPAAAVTESPVAAVPAPAAAPAASAPLPPKRPINPFLANDPNQKARRLARVLVSDMVTYHPQKREEGLRNGTLKQQFRDEIRKSYEEYVEQVGREFAEATAHFQDALNEILAGGQRLF
jgi:predicted Zn finger-like uncharacterized protein